MNKNDIVDIAYGEEFAVDFDGRKIHFDAVGGSDWRVFDHETGSYICTICEDWSEHEIDEAIRFGFKEVA